MDPTILTVCYLIKNGNILLGLKKVRIGKGLLNGPGGHLEPGDDSIADRAKIEFKDETGFIITSELKEVGILLVTYEDTDFIAEIHFFTVSNVEGFLIETDEMIPEWHKLNNIPYDRMWPNDRYCLPIILDGGYFEGHFHYDNLENKTLLNHWVDRVEILPKTINPNRL